MIKKLGIAIGVLGAALLLSGCQAMGTGHGMQGMNGSHAMGIMHSGNGTHEMSEEHAAHMQAMQEAGTIEATAVLQAYSDAINAEDVAAMAAQVVADERFSVIEGGGTNIGWADYRDHHIGPEFASERIDFHVYGYHDIDVRVGHRFAYATFTYAFEATLDGDPYNKEGRGTAVFMRTPEGWRIRHIQTS